MLRLLLATPFLLLAGAAFAQSDQAQYRTADADGDGALNRTEFRTFINSQASSGNGTAKTVRLLRAYAIAFGRIDTDKNGSISRAELAAAANAKAE